MVGCGDRGLIIFVAAFAYFRYQADRPTEVVELATAPTVPPPEVPKVDPVVPTPEDRTRAMVDQHLEAAKSCPGPTRCTPWCSSLCLEPWSLTRAIRKRST